MPDALLSGALSTQALLRARDALTKKHLATLGGGNHFLELDRDPSDGLWLLVHSGSRGLGAAIAAHHTRVAETFDADPLAGLVASSAAGQAYLADLDWALMFAQANRRALANLALEVIEATAEDHLDVPHNFVAREVWDGDPLIVHRKGAVSVPRGARALVPGSMATASYVVEGLGNGLAFDSCSHGAGRILTRTEARAKIRPAALARAMKGIVWPAHLGGPLVEEAPGAYRDIREVLEDQADLVKRVVRLEPMLVLKG